MNIAQLIPMLPLLIVATTSVVVMLAVAVARRHEVTVAITVAGLALALASLFYVASLADQTTVSLLVLDNQALFYIGLVTAPGLVAHESALQGGVWLDVPSFAV